MSKNKIIVTFSIPVEVKKMLEELADRSYSTNTKCFVDMIRKDHAYWFKEEKEEN